jgi:hypothetical protein
MYSIYEISLIIIAFIVLFIYINTTSKSNECDAEENFGNFTSTANTSPVIAYINSKYNSTKDINIKKSLYIPKIFLNNAYYVDLDYSRISKLSMGDLGSYVKNNNQLYFIDLLNQFTQDICGPSEFRILLTMFANNYIQFNNIDQEANQILSKHITLYTEVKKAHKLYNDMLANNKIDLNLLNQISSQIDSILSNVIQQLPAIINIINKIKTLKYNNQYVTLDETVDKNVINTYKSIACASTSFDSITGSKSRLLNQIKSYNQKNNRNKFNKNNIEFWIPFYVKINFTQEDISRSNDLQSINDVFTTIIFPKIFNYSLTLIDLMNQLKNQQDDDTIVNAIDFFNKYVSSYLIVYIDVVTGQSDVDVLLELQDLESQVNNLYDLIIAA